MATFFILSSEMPLAPSFSFDGPKFDVNSRNVAAMLSVG